MNQCEILKNRTLNYIGQIKYSLEGSDQMSLYNDLLILQHIIPHLSVKTLRKLLKEMKPHKNEGDITEKVKECFPKIMALLAQTPCRHPLLKDFLSCAYNPITSRDP